MGTGWVPQGPVESKALYLPLSGTKTSRTATPGGSAGVPGLSPQAAGTRQGGQAVWLQLRRKSHSLERSQPRVRGRGLGTQDRRATVWLNRGWRHRDGPHQHLCSSARHPAHLLPRCEGGQLLDLGGLVVAAPSAQEDLAAHPLLWLRGVRGCAHAAHHVVQVLHVLGRDRLVVVTVLWRGGDLLVSGEPTPSPWLAQLGAAAGCSRSDTPTLSLRDRAAAPPPPPGCWGRAWGCLLHTHLALALLLRAQFANSGLRTGCLPAL